MQGLSYQFQPNIQYICDWGLGENLDKFPQLKSNIKDNNMKFTKNVHLQIFFNLVQIIITNMSGTGKENTNFCFLNKF